MDSVTWDCFRVWGILHHTSWAIARNRQNEVAEAHTTVMQASVLFILKNIKGPMTPAQISRWLFREPQSVSSLLNHMEREGLLRRVRDLDKKNMVRVELTEKGDETYGRSLENTGILLDIFSCLSSDELAQFEKCLLRLRSRAIKKLGLKRSQTNSLLHPPLDGLTTV